MKLELEDFGILTIPISEYDVKYDVRAIDKYCKEKNISTEDLTLRELNTFVITEDKEVINY